MDGAVFCEASAQGVERFAHLHGEQLEFAVEFGIRDGEIFKRGDLVEDERALDLAEGGVALGGAQAVEVERAHLLLCHALLGERAEATVEACFDLLLDEGFGHGEGVFAGEGFKDPVLGRGLGLALLVGGEVLAELDFELVHGLVLAELPGKFIVHFGRVLVLDALDFDVIGDGLAGEAGFPEIGRVGDFELEFLAGFGAAQGVVEGRQGVFAADLKRYVLGGDGFAKRDRPQ